VSLLACEGRWQFAFPFRCGHLSTLDPLTCLRLLPRAELTVQSRPHLVTSCSFVTGLVLLCQVCSAGSRLLVQESVFEDLIGRLKERMTHFRLGHSLDKVLFAQTLTLVCEGTAIGSN